MLHKNKSIGITILIATVFVIAFGLMFPKDTEKYLRGHFWVKKAHAPSKYNMIVLGDSRIYRGIAVKSMEDILTDFKILNFGYSSGGLNPEIYKVGFNKLDAELEPKVIVLGVTAFSLTQMSKKNAHYKGEINRKKEDVLEKLYLGKALNWFSPVTPKKIEKEIKNEPPTYLYTHDYQYGGWVASEKIPVDTTNAVKSYIQTFSKGGVSEELVTALEMQIGEWTKNGIHVYAFRPPISQPMLALADSTGGYNKEYLKGKITKAGGYWIELNNYAYNTYDGSHLHRDSAVKMSEKLAREIKKDLENKGMKFQ